MATSPSTERAEGKVQEIAGSLKKGVGRLIGNEQMEAEGKAKEMMGQAHQEKAKAGQRVKGAVEELTGSVKKHVGKVIDNEQMEAEGKAKEMTGQVRQKINR